MSEKKVYPAFQEAQILWECDFPNKPELFEGPSQRTDRTQGTKRQGRRTRGDNQQLPPVLLQKQPNPRGEVRRVHPV